MGQPGKFAPPGGEDWIGRKFADLERQFRELAAANVFGTTGITPQDGGTDFDGYVNVNGDMTVDGPLEVNGATAVNGPLEVTGAANFTGNTTIGGSASIAGDITKTNSWGASSLGPVVFGAGAPSLTFTKNGTTYGQPVGIGLTRNGADTADQVTVNGPHASDPSFLALRSDKTFLLASDNNTGPQIQSEPGGNGALNLFGGTTNGSVWIQPAGTGKCQVAGNFAVSGSKAFIMDHPVNPATMELMHAATESPVNGVEYWGTATVGSAGSVTVQLPGYFEALTKPANRNVQLTPSSPCASVPWASAITGGKFTITAPAGAKLHWLVKAERHQIVNGYDVLSFPVEQDKPLIGPQLPTAER